MSKNNTITLVHDGDTPKTHKFAPAGVKDRKVLRANNLREFTVYHEMKDGFDPEDVEIQMTVKVIKPTQAE